MNWKSQIPGCFGNADQIFAGHPMDKNRAFQLLTDLRKEQVGWSEVAPEFEKQMRSAGCGDLHVAEQMLRISAQMKNWLND